MLNGISAAISAIKTLEKKLSVTANNTANVNTQGFKASNASSAEVSPQNPPATAGAAQIGRGTTLGQISQNYSSGSYEPTSSATDMAVGGTGYFIVKDFQGAEYYTRDGQFSFDKDGRFVNTSGQVVQGWELDPNTGETQGSIKDATLTSFYSSTNGAGAGNLQAVGTNRDGVITGSYSNGDVLALFQVAIAKFNNPQALNKIGNNLYSRTTASGDAITGMPGTNGLGPIIPNALEQSNVDLGTEAVKLIMIQRSLQANLSVIRTEDELKGDLIDILS